MKFIELFDRAYVINLPQRVDRRNAIELELNHAGLPFTPDRVELFSAIRPDSPGGFESIGYHGCFLSHLEVLKQAKANGAKNVLVMEDDLFLTPDFNRHEAAIAQQLCQTDWDLVHFGYYPEIAPKFDQAADVLLQPCCTELIGSHFYAVNGKAFDRLIDFLEGSLQRPAGHPQGGPMSPDGALNVFQQQTPDIIRLLTVPALGGQRSSRSDISPSWFDRTPVLEQIASAARELGIPKIVKGLFSL